MSVVSNEVLVLLDHESTVHILRVVRCGLEVFDPQGRFKAMALRFMAWNFSVYMMIVDASELLFSSKCHFLKRQKCA